MIHAVATPAPIRKRSSRACDACRLKRTKCEDIEDIRGSPTCRACRENHQECLYTQAARKRGPRQQKGSDGGQTDSGDNGPSSDSGLPAPRLKPSEALWGVPSSTIDQLLAVYFTHVHNVWPLISKPFFHAPTAPAHLLLAMLAVASCVAPNLAREGLSSDKLFKMAERSVQSRRLECRLDVVQSLILLSLRQTGNGDKRGAAIYSGQACTLAVIMGLHQIGDKPADGTSPETNSHARVYWNCYVLDKMIAEETGRPCLLSYRRSSVPFPSTNELDEFETWPPLPASTARLPSSVRHVVPRRGHVLSCFVWTCRLAMIVEDLVELDEDVAAMSTSEEEWDRQFVASRLNRRDGREVVDGIAAQLELWEARLPRHLRYDPAVQSEGYPLPHVVISLGACRIMLYTRSKRVLSTRGRAMASPLNTTHIAYAVSHTTCTRAAQTIIDMLSRMDQHKLLGSVSADTIHILSLATLCQVYDSKSRNIVVAENAKRNFAKCSTWLRDFASAWPTASSHRLFFDSLVQGGIQLTNAKIATDGSVALANPHEPNAGVAESLRSMGEVLSKDDEPPHVEPSPDFPADLGLSNLVQLPQYFWNYLSQPDQDVQASNTFNPFAQSYTGDSALFDPASMGFGVDDGLGAAMPDFRRDSTDSAFVTAPTNMGPMVSGNDVSQMDEAAVRAALMQYMVDATRT